MSDRLHLYLDGIPIGTVGNVIQDMWYMEGRWAPGAEAARFTGAARALDPRAGILRGEGILVRYSTAPGEALHDGLVMGMTDGNITVRMLSPEAAAAIRERQGH